MAGRNWKDVLPLPLLDAVVLGAIVGGWYLYEVFQLNNFEYFYDDRTGAVNFLNCAAELFRFGVPAALVVFVVELIVHQLCMRSSVGALKRILLPFIDALVLGLIAGAVFLYVDFHSYNQIDYYDVETGMVYWPHSARMFLVQAAIVAPAVLVAELIVHQIRRIFRR